MHIFLNASPATQGAAKVLVKALGDVPLAANGPFSISAEVAKQSGVEESDGNTIILVVHTK